MSYWQSCRWQLAHAATLLCQSWWLHPSPALWPIAHRKPLWWRKSSVLPTTGDQWPNNYGVQKISTAGHDPLALLLIRVKKKTWKTNSLFDLFVQPSTESRCWGVLKAAIQLRHFVGDYSLRQVLTRVVQPQSLRSTHASWDKATVT